METGGRFLISLLASPLSIALLASCASTPPPPTTASPPDPRAIAGEPEPILLATDAFLRSKDAQGKVAARASAPATSPAPPSPPAAPSSPTPVASIEPAAGTPEAAPSPAPASADDGFRERLARLRPLAAKRAEERSLRETLEYNQLIRELVSLYFLGRAPDAPLEFFDALEHLESPSIDVRALAVAIYQSVGLTEARDRAIEDLRAATLGTEEFSLRETAFAKEVLGLGSYTRIPADALRPGQTVLVYGELAGLRSRPSGEGRYRRVFRLRLAVVDRAGKEYDRRTFQPKDESAEAIPAVFFSVPYEIPRILPPGEYRLTVEAEDLEGKGRDEGEIVFRTR